MIKIGDPLPTATLMEYQHAEDGTCATSGPQCTSSPGSSSAAMLPSGRQTRISAWGIARPMLSGWLPTSSGGK